jgi:hypothetical protein
MSNTIEKIILSPLFLIGLFLLFLNDFVLKSQFHNFLTGKLSDFAGLFVFSLFFIAFFPKRKAVILVFTAILFIFWKSAYSKNVIEFWNSLELFRIGRTIDHTDFFAVLVLPFSLLYSNYRLSKNKIRLPLNRFAGVFLVFTSIFAFTATSYEQDRNISYGKKYNFRFTQTELIERLKKIEKISDLDADDLSSNKLANGSPAFTAFTYTFHFKLQAKYCESSKIRVFMYLDNSKNNENNLELGSINYWCEQKPTDEDKQALLEIFEREVIEKLK